MKLPIKLKTINKIKKLPKTKVSDTSFKIMNYKPANIKICLKSVIKEIEQPLK